MADLNMLLNIGTVVKIAKNETVFMQHETGDCMYIVMDGTFGVYINSFSDFPVHVADIGQGLFFGEMSVIDGSPRSATIIAEDDCSALVIGKNHFETLLEKSPEIGSTILNTLRGRANTTADAIRKSGKEPPPLPPLLRVVEYTDAKRGLNFMTMLAEYQRKMNDMLAKQTLNPQPAAIEISNRTGLIKLLPDGYKDFNLNDVFESDGLLVGGKVVCPYCRKEFHARFPNFSKLEQKETRIDQRIIFKNFDILWYTNIVCPNCCYTDSYQEFNQGLLPERTKISGNQFKNVEGFAGFESPIKHTLDEVIKSYYLRLVCVGAIAADPLRMANIWMRLYWLYSDNSARQLAIQAAGTACEYYTRYADNNARYLSGEESMRTNAIMAELFLYSGQKDKSLELFLENTKVSTMFGSELMRQSIQRYKEIEQAP